MTLRMYTDAKAFIVALGGYRQVAERVGMRATTLHTHMMSGKLPPKWYGAFRDLACELGVEEPGDELFSFEALPEHGRESANPAPETKGDAA